MDSGNAERITKSNAFRKRGNGSQNLIDSGDAERVTDLMGSGNVIIGLRMVPKTRMDSGDAEMGPGIKKEVVVRVPETRKRLPE